MGTADIAWVIWIAVLIISLVALEIWGLRRPGGTLSERLRAWLGVTPHKPWRVWGIAVLLGALAFFAYHIVG